MFTEEKLKFIKIKSKTIFSHLYDGSGLDLVPELIDFQDDYIYITNENTNIITLMKYEEDTNTPNPI